MDFLHFSYLVQSIIEPHEAGQVRYSYRFRLQKHCCTERREDEAKVRRVDRYWNSTVDRVQAG